MPITTLHACRSTPFTASPEVQEATLTAGAMAKRSIDFVGAVAGLVLFGIPLLVCGLWIRTADGGPILYRQWRVGHDGWLFRVLKLRTMAINAEADGQPRFACNGDPRILRGCAWMRKSHIDELPQLVNVLRGQMSLVGPRPERPEMLDRLRSAIPAIERRLAALPGITGLAQVRNGYTNDIPGARLRQAYDLRYVRHGTLRGDMGLILATLPKFWDRHGW